MEPEDSSPHLQVPATCPCPEPDQSSLCPPNPLYIHLNSVLTYTRVFQVVALPQVSPPKAIYTSLLPHMCYVPRPSHSSVFYHPKDIFNILIYLCLFSFSIATSTSKKLDSGATGSAVRISVCLTSLTMHTYCSQDKRFLNPDKIVCESVTKYPSFLTILF